VTYSTSLAQKAGEVLSETHRDATSPSSESNSWNQLFNKPFTLLAFGVELSLYKAQKGYCKRRKNERKQSQRSK
jgi:hypothetical protein